MNDPRWPSLREAARRFLREENCVLILPEKYMESGWKIVQAISDNIPSRIEFPEIKLGEFQITGIAYFGQTQPPIDVCWVPNCSWDDFKIQVLDLLEAGYPGCVGCGGPGSEEEWNEQSRRSQFVD